MLNFKWTNIHQEMRKIELLSDDTEKALRYQSIDNIINKINEYNEHISNYEYARKIQEIKNRGVSFIPQSKPETIKANWSKLFASSINAEEKKAIGYKYYKWHIFSFKKVNAFSNSKARHAFNKAKKEKVFVFYQHKAEAFYIENAGLLKSTDFDSDNDIYIYDTINKWTYVHTHEIQCGPYFYYV